MKGIATCSRCYLPTTASGYRRAQRIRVCQCDANPKPVDPRFFKQKPMEFYRMVTPSSDTTARFRR